MKTIIRDKAHLAFIRKLPCLRCSSQPSQAAHIRKGANGGTGIKSGDDYTLPLCFECHAYQHQIGEPAFFGSMDKAHYVARQLYLFSGDIVSAINIIGVNRHELFTQRQQPEIFLH